MMHKKFVCWWQKLLRPIVVRLAVTAVLTIGMLGLLLSIPPIGYAETLFQTSVTTNTQQISPTGGSQYKLKTPVAAVYRSPDCTCCGAWINHLKRQGFEIKDFPTSDMEAVKQKRNVPDYLTSCHTAIVDGYVIEGHVPASDIKRLLRDKPNVVGLSVPQMPVGTPGMEMGNKKDPFRVFSFDRKGVNSVFNNYF